MIDPLSTTPPLPTLTPRAVPGAARAAAARAAARTVLGVAAVPLVGEVTTARSTLLLLRGVMALEPPTHR